MIRAQFKGNTVRIMKVSINTAIPVAHIGGISKWSLQAYFYSNHLVKQTGIYTDQVMTFSIKIQEFPKDNFPQPARKVRPYQSFLNT